MSANSQSAQCNPIFNRSLWTITSNLSLYVLRNDEKSDPKKPWRYLKLGKVVGVVTYSKTWANEHGLKKTVFKVCIERPAVRSNDGDRESLELSFSCPDIENDVYILQEHMFSDFRNHPPTEATYLPPGPTGAPTITCSFHKDKLGKQGNWLKKPLSKLLNPPSTMPSADDWADSFNQSPPSAGQGSLGTSRLDGASASAAAVFGGSKSSSSGHSSPLSPSSNTVFESLFSGGSLMTSQQGIICMLYECVFWYLQCVCSHRGTKEHTSQAFGEFVGVCVSCGVAPSGCDKKKSTTNEPNSGPITLQPVR